MKFEPHFPIKQLKPYINYFVVSENELESEYKVFPSSGLVINSANIGTVLVYFAEIGFTYFASHPANELFNLSLSLDDIFERIKILEQFLLNQLKDIETGKFIVEAVKLIYQTKGTIRIKELNGKLLISQIPFEKRFRKVVGTTAKVIDAEKR